MSFSFAALAPTAVAAKNPKFAADNDAALGERTFGIEVTEKALAERCGLGNIDPQHGGGNAHLAAIDVAMTCPLPPEGATLATIRPDLDALGAMAVLSLRAKGVLPSDGQGPLPEPSEADARAGNASFAERVRLVSEADRFDRGGWPGPKPLPTRDNPWAGANRALAAIAACVGDFKIPMAQRVEAMEKWLMTGEEPAASRAQVESERMDLVAALERGDIKTHVVGRVAVVESGHRAATAVGYALAPVVVAFNRAFRLQGGEPHLKFTVCQFKPGHVDLKKALAELQKLEPGWGGSPVLIGSTQGVASPLEPDTVVEVVARCLLE